MYKHLYKQAWPPRWLWQPRWNLGFGQWWEMLTSRTSLKSSRRILRPCSHSMKHSIRQHPALTFNTNMTNMSFDLSATLTLSGGAVHGTFELRGQHRPSEASGGGQSEKDKGTSAKRWTPWFNHCVSGHAEVGDLLLHHWDYFWVRRWVSRHPCLSTHRENTSSAWMSSE